MVSSFARAKMFKWAEMKAIVRASRKLLRLWPVFSGEFTGFIGLSSTTVCWILSRAATL